MRNHLQFEHFEHFEHVVASAGAARGRQGRGSRWYAGFGGAIGVRRRAPCVGSDVTTSGASADRSVRSIAATTRLGARDSIGGTKTRAQSAWHTGHDHVGGADPMGRATSVSPWVVHR
jgi:hypothetical protein